MLEEYFGGLVPWRSSSFGQEVPTGPHSFGEAKVGEHHTHLLFGLGAHKNVLQFYVPVNDPSTLYMQKGLGKLADYLARNLTLERSELTVQKLVVEVAKFVVSKDKVEVLLIFKNLHKLEALTTCLDQI